MKLHKFLMVLTMILVIIMAMIVWFFPSNDDFRVGNPFWNGTKHIASSYAVTPLETLSDLPNSPRDAVLIIIPYLQFSAADLDSVSNFITNGGTVIIADDYGYGNQITEYLGLPARFSGQPLLDPITHYKNHRFPNITRVRPSPLTINVEKLVFNHATGLYVAETSAILVQSSIFSFLDTNNDQVRQENEPTGPLPVISLHGIGKGKVLLVSDPSIFINSMEKMGNNDNFMQNIASMTTSNILVDQSHLQQSNLSQAKALLTRIRGSLTTPPGTLGLVIVLLTITLMPIWRRRR